MVVQLAPVGTNVDNAPGSGDDVPVESPQLFENEPSEDPTADTLVNVGNSSASALGGTGPNSDDIIRKGKLAMPVSSVSLHRSARSNKYDGFKVPAITDSKPRSSKVKPRINPSALQTRARSDEDDSSVVPPPTPIATLQLVGTVKCAIPAAELSEEVLNEAPEDALSSSSSS